MKKNLYLCFPTKKRSIFQIDSFLNDNDLLIEETSFKQFRKAFIVDHQLKKNFLKDTENLVGSKNEILFIHPTEEFKSLKGLAYLVHWLEEKRFRTDTVLIGIGGGALLDLVAFTASVFCRGIPFISMPTTLLAMTDAAIGGKTGVNTKNAKNGIGTFYLPEKVLVDVEFLKTIKSDDFKNSLAESIKHGLIADPSLLELIDQNLEKIFSKNNESLKQLIFKSCQVKLSIIKEDPLDVKNVRALLNFGHTVGHALEIASNFSIPHGKAVFIGMKIESAISCEMEALSLGEYLYIETLLKPFINPSDFFCFDPEKIWEIIFLDKKVKNQEVKFIQIKEIGKAQVTRLPKNAFLQGWYRALCCHAAC